MESGRLLRPPAGSKGCRGIAGRGSSLYGASKSAKSMESSFCCDSEGKDERGPALLDIPGVTGLTQRLGAGVGEGAPERAWARGTV